MESIEQMIKRLCPKGVEYVKLGKVASIKNGRDHKKYEDGDVPVYGSSCGATKATTSKELYKALKEAFSWDNKILIEPAVNVREIECSVTGNKEEDIKAYIPGEITPNHEFYDYDAKYLDPQGAVLTIPADVSSDQREQIRTLAVQAYKALDCTGLSRVDFFIDKDSGDPYNLIHMKIL